MPGAENKGFTLFWGERVYCLAKTMMVWPQSGCLVTCILQGPHISYVQPSSHSAFTPSPVLRCNFPPQSLCPWHSSLCLEGSSHISPYVPPALALLLVAHEIILCAQEWINSAILCSPMHLTPLLCGPPPRVSFILRASSSCPFHQKRLKGHEVMGRDLPFMIIAVMPGSMTLNKYLWN